MTGINVGGVAPASAPPATPVLYAAQGAVVTTSDLYTVDPLDGSATSVGAIGFALTGLSFRPSDSVLFGVTSTNSSSNPASLVTVDPVTGTGTLVGALGVQIADIAFRSDDALYGYSPSNRTLYTINTSTGTATQVSATAIPTSGSGYGDAFDSSDTLYVFPKNSNGAFYIVDETTGGLTAQTALTGSPLGGSKPITACSFDQTSVLWATIISLANAWVVTIDLGTSVITTVGLSNVSYLDALAWTVP